jgi:hypothetical protein
LRKRQVSYKGLLDDILIPMVKKDMMGYGSLEGGMDL